MTPRPHTKWPVALVTGIAGSILVGLVVLAFVWPTRTTEVRDLPVGIAGPAQGVSTVESAAEDAAPGAVDFVGVDDRADAVARIESRDLYGAIVLPAAPGTAPEVLTSPAGSPLAAQLLSGIATQLQAGLAEQIAAAGGDPTKAAVTVTAVVPLADTDSNGSGLVAAAFPLTMGGMLGGILVSLLIVGPLRRLLALAGFAVATGAIVALVMQTWFEFLQGDFLLNAGAVGLSVLATSAFIVGLTSLVGRAGIAIGAVLTLFVGNPLGAAAVPWQFLPSPWGLIGQFMVPGASNHLLRSLSYFPDADTAPQWWTLAAWAAFGVILTVAGHFRSQMTMPVPAATIEEPEKLRNEVAVVG